MTTAKDILEHAAAMMKLEVLSKKRSSEDFEQGRMHRITQRATRDAEQMHDRDRANLVAEVERAERDRRVLEVERARRRERPPAPPAGPPILSEAEIEEMRRTTPRPAPRGEVTLDDVADAVAKAWKSRFGEPTPVANATLLKMRGGGR